MIEVHVQAIYAAERERVFLALVDHERFLATRGFACSVVEPGSPNRNGLGALREVRGRGAGFTETITAFEPPRSFDYRVEKLVVRGLGIPVSHERGWLELTAVDGGTRVDWRTRYRLDLPLIGGLLSRAAAPVFRRTFA